LRTFITTSRDKCPQTKKSQIASDLRLCSSFLPSRGSDAVSFVTHHS
jgi:hypothetical protein